MSNYPKEDYQYPAGIFLYSSNELLKGKILNSINIKWDDDYLIFADKFGRKFKLTPVQNENIKFPFIIEPIFDGDKK